MAVSIHGNNGVITTNGTAAAPSLAAPDNDTGFFFGTNLIKASTSGTERLHIQSDGKSTFSEDVRIVKTSGPLLELTTNTGAADATLRLSEGTTGSTTNGGGMYYSGSDNKLHITCGTNSTTKRITIQRDDGKVGVGIDSPTAKFEVQNGSNIEVLRLKDTHYNKYLTIRGGGSPNRMVIDSYEGGGGGADIDFASNGSTKVRITSTGNVNIGGNFTQTTYNASITTGSVNKKISFGAAAHNDLSNEGSGIFFSRQSDGSAELSGIFAHSNSSLGIAARTDITLHAGGSSTYGAAPERLRIASDGTATATGTSDGVLQLDTSDSRGAFIRFGQGGSYHHMIGCADGLVAGPDKEDLGLRAKDNMVFCTNGASERVRIDSHGCVRVGNTATQSTSGNTKRIALGAKGSIQGWVSGQLNGHIQLIDNYYWDGSNNKVIEADHCAYLSLRSGALRFGATDSTQTAGQNVSGGIHERFRIEPDGTVGIGEDDPDGNKLLIRAASTAGTNKGHIMLTGDSATNGQGPQIVFSESGSGSNWVGGTIGFKRTGGNGIGNLIFGVRTVSGDANTVPTEVVHLTSTGYVGINTDNPTYMLHVKEDSSVVARFERTGGAWAKVDIKAGNSSGNSYLTFSDTDAAERGEINYEHSDDSLRFGTAGTANRMKIDSDGYVTKPNTPYFHVQASPSISNTPFDNGLKQFANVRSNNGSHYDNSTGVFTVPVAGFYFFSASLWSQNSDANNGNNYALIIRRDSNGNNEIQFAGANHHDQWDNLMMAAGYYCAVGDQIYVFYNGSIQGSTPRNYFSGCLIG